MIKNGAQQVGVSAGSPMTAAGNDPVTFKLEDTVTAGHSEQHGTVVEIYREISPSTSYTDTI